MYMFITPVFVYVNIAFIFECIYLGIEFRNEHVFCSDHMIMYIYRKKERSSEEKINKMLFLARLSPDWKISQFLQSVEKISGNSLN